MKNVSVESTRNFALVGHAADGKTSLGDALLHRAGATPVHGKVDDGSSVLNHLPEEKERRSTISSSVFGFDWNGHHLTLVDTPGDPNFIADGQIALQGLDGAVLVVSGVDGPKVGTEKMLRTARERGVACVAIVSGLDRERADLDRAVEGLRKLELNAVPIALPIGAGEQLAGVVDLLTGKAVRANGEGDAPADMAEAVRRIAGGAKLEASGGVRLETVAAIAASGVDAISVGALTHSARALDISLELEF